MANHCSNHCVFRQFYVGDGICLQRQTTGIPIGVRHEIARRGKRTTFPIKTEDGIQIRIYAMGLLIAQFFLKPENGIPRA